MILLFERNDITRMKVDAIVNAANNTLLGGGGVDGMIHEAAGPKLLEECKTLGGCETGDAKITKGYNLPAKYVIHTVGPIYQDGKHGEKEKLKSCYTNSLKIAVDKKLKSIAFPLISAGIFGYPKEDAMHVAIDSIKKFFKDKEDIDIKVTLVFFGKTTMGIGLKVADGIKEYIDDNYVKEHGFDRNIRKCYNKVSDFDFVGNLDASFADTLLKIIDKKKLKDADVYRAANMDRKLFSKIRSGSHPKKSTAISLCIALNLSYKDTSDLLLRAGYVLTNSNLSDVIIMYYIKKKIYDVNKINATLFSYDLPQIGV